MSYSQFDFPHTHFYDSDLRELIKYVETLWKRVNTLDSWMNEHEKEYLELKNLYDNIISGNFPDSIKEAFDSWMRNNAVDIIGKMCNMVIFNITDDGYFVAYIPESWDEIQFGTTGLDVITELQPDYGHLVLSYKASTNAY